MKKLIIIFISAGMALVSCKSHLDGLASNTADDVYYNPAKDHKANVAPQPTQYEQQPYNPNAGKIAATAADKNNPYYQDPKFNYDDYYDNAYAARVKRFQQPLYGTSYYDSYYTNSYFYNNNPTSYGTSIYSSYNMGSPSYGSSMYGAGMGYGSGYGGYYSPSAMFNNAYYNPYYNGFGNGMGYGSGYGMSYGMGYGSGYGMGCGSPYSMGYGYNPYSSYGMGYGGGGMGYGYNPYGMGMGYGTGYSSPMYSSGYYNNLDYNSGTYHNGPRGTHAGGNSTTTSPMPQTHHMVKNTPENGYATTAAAPFSQERFNQVAIPRENYIKMVEAKNPVNMNYQPNGGMTTNQPNEGRPNHYYNGTNNNPTYNNGAINSNSYNGGGAVRPAENYATPHAIQNPNVNQQTAEPRHKWFSGTSFGGDNGGSNNNGGWNNNSVPSSSPSRSSGSWGGGGSFGGGGSSGGGSSGGGGISHPRR